ncbi:hypothetical protein [Komarekiella delphini-convector]|uniref:hypothetical protein n=1 Tax=Komarekiella delphini-convector TaxID=3050158 RepID=UPI0017876D69|nr:hypothetical protein [Komarekiella delphini-convector]
MSEVYLFSVSCNKAFRRLSCGSDGRTSVWEVKNLHGARVKDFWQSEKNEADTASNKADNVSIKANTATIETNIATQNQSEQGFQEPSRTPQKLLTNSSKEIVRSNSSTSYENTHCDKTAMPTAASYAPFGGASPQTLESVEEKKEEELPTVTDCASLALVDAVQGQSASLRDPARTLLGENQDCGVETIIPHEDTCFTAPVALNFEEPAQHSLSTSLRDATRTLIGENQISSDEDKTLHVDQSSVAPAPNADKWSSEALFTAEAIAARSKARPVRMQKLKLAEVLRENPGFEFLTECWNDDPALQIVIRKLLAKFGQWVVACVDGELVNTNLCPVSQSVVRERAICKDKVLKASCGQGD